jgi:2-methylcitrate dehydratase PrpD
VDTVLERLAARWSRVTAEDLPGEVVEVGRQCLLDWFGCALAGSREPLAEMIRLELATPGASTVIGTVRTAPARDAALINGAAGHALDFDDTHMLLMGHPTVPVLPAALAVAEERDLDGPALLTAFVAGVEVECRVGALLAPAHYLAGWHATGTVGTIGAAAAVAHLLQLDPERTVNAMALAATQAAGLKASFGTMAKPLHAGKAAADGLLAAMLAARGFTGNPAVLEAAQGLAQAAGGTVLDPARLDGLEDRWTIRDTLFKYHAACYLTHASINAALALDVAAAEVDSVEVHVAEDSLKVCNIAEPATGLEAKFSLRATTAMALLGDDTTDMAAYRDARMADADLVALRDKVRVVPVGDRPGTRSQVVVTTTDGRKLQSEADTGIPAADLDLQMERLASKFHGLAAPVLGDEGADRLRQAVVGLAGGRDLARLTRPVSPSQ